MTDTFDPTASPKAILTWVDGFPGRAHDALEAELAKPSPRAGLVADLEKIRAGEVPT